MTTASPSSRVLGVLRQRPLAVLATGLLAAASITATSTVAGAEDDPRSDVVYDSMPTDGAVSHPSYGLQATSMAEWGDRIQLAGENRVPQTLTVSMNSWACETGAWHTADCDTTPGATFTHPITVTFYAVDDSGAEPQPGAVLLTSTQDITVPFRPSVNEAECGTGTTQWYSAATDTCQNGYEFDAAFDLSGFGIELPDEVIASVSYPTADTPGWGNGAWSSLNITIAQWSPAVGTDAEVGEIYVAWDTAPDDFSRDTGWANYSLGFNLTAAPAAALVEQTAHTIGFEDSADVESADGGLSGATIVEGTDAMAAAAGCFYATAPVVEYSADVFTRYSGYSSVFPTGGYTASADFYLGDTADAGQFSWSHAANGTDGVPQRDFIFHADSDGAGTWTVGVSNNVVTAPPFITTYPTTPIAIADEGWYTFQHTLREQDGLLYVDLAVLDADGVELGSWTLGGNAADQIPSAVGGNRYGWLVNNSFEGLAIDNVLLNAERPTAGCGVDDVDVTPDTESGDVADAEAATPVTADPTYAG